MSSFVQFKEKTTGSGTSDTVTFTSNVTIGDALVAFSIFASATDVTSVTDTLGNTWLRAFTTVTSAGSSLSGWYVLSSIATGACTVTFNYNANAIGMRQCIAEYVPPASPALDVGFASTEPNSFLAATLPWSASVSGDCAASFGGWTQGAFSISSGDASYVTRFSDTFTLYQDRVTCPLGVQSVSINGTPSGCCCGDVAIIGIIAFRTGVVTFSDDDNTNQIAYPKNDKILLSSSFSNELAAVISDDYQVPLVIFEQLVMMTKKSSFDELPFIVQDESQLPSSIFERRIIQSIISDDSIATSTITDDVSLRIAFIVPTPISIFSSYEEISFQPLPPPFVGYLPPLKGGEEEFRWDGGARWDENIAWELGINREYPREDVLENLQWGGDIDWELGVDIYGNKVTFDAFEKRIGMELKVEQDMKQFYEMMSKVVEIKEHPIVKPIQYIVVGYLVYRVLIFLG